MARPKRAVLEYRSYELPSGFPLIVLTGDEWRISPRPSERLHFHNCLEIGICHSGAGTMLFDRQPVDFEAGCVTCIARNVPHTTWSRPDDLSLWSYIFLDPEQLLGYDLFRQLAPLSQSGDFLSDCRILLSPAQARWAGPLVNAILAEMTERRANYRSCVRGYSVALLVQLLRAYGDAAPNRAPVENIHTISPALEHIQRHYMGAFDQDTLAEACHLSTSHFRRLFRAQMNTTPLAFFHQTRILNSCVLLRSSERLISEIAAMVGYDSLSCFNRHFQQVMGCTPSEWRRTSDGIGRPALLEFSGWTRAEAPDGPESRR